MHLGIQQLRRPSTARKQLGFSLIELMISITIGLLLLAGLVGVLSVTSGNSRTNDIASELMTTGRFALDTLKREVRQAGFRGYTSADPQTPTALGTFTGECLETGATAGDFLSNFRQSVWGVNHTSAMANPFAGNCIPSAAYLAGNDILAVRRLSTFPVTTALAANTLYFQSTYAQGQLFRGSSTPVVAPNFANSPVPLATFAVQTYVYFISPYSVSASESPLVPALYRVALQPDGTMTRELVASGIERMQVQYGVAGAAGSMQYVDAVAGTSINSSTTGWDDVQSVRIWLLARSTRAEPGYTNSNTYVMGDLSYTVADGFRRQVLSTTVQLRKFR